MASVPSLSRHLHSTLIASPSLRALIIILSYCPSPFFPFSPPRSLFPPLQHLEECLLLTFLHSPVFFLTCIPSLIHITCPSCLTSLFISSSTFPFSLIVFPPPLPFFLLFFPHTLTFLFTIFPSLHFPFLLLFFLLPLSIFLTLLPPSPISFSIPSFIRLSSTLLHLISLSHLHKSLHGLTITRPNQNSVLRFANWSGLKCSLVLVLSRKEKVNRFRRSFFVSLCKITLGKVYFN